MKETVMQRMNSNWIHSTQKMDIDTAWTIVGMKVCYSKLWQNVHASLALQMIIIKIKSPNVWENP